MEAKTTGMKDNLARRRWIGNIFLVLLIIATLVGLLMLTILIIDIAVKGADWFSAQIFTNYHSRKSENAGMKSAIVGSSIVR